MSASHPWDQISLDHLLASGARKWSGADGCIGTWIAEMDFPIAEPITAALQRELDDSAFGYLPRALATDLQHATADFYRERYGWDVDPERVWLASDVLAVLDVVMTQVLEPGAKIVLPTPAYMPFLTLPVARSREIIQVPMLVDDDGRYSMDLAGIADAFDDGGGLLILCNPANPVGTVFTREELVAISEVVEAHGARVFNDEVHAPLIYDGGPKHVPYPTVSPSAAGHTITATSASKSWNLAGLKCAQVIVTDEDVARAWPPIDRWVQTAVSTPGTVANIAAYRDGGPWLSEVLAYLDRNRVRLGELLAEHLPGARYRVPDGTYLAWVDCRDLDLPTTPGKFFIANAQVMGTSGEFCGEAGRGFLRLNLATPTPVLEETVRRMGAAVRAL